MVNQSHVSWSRQLNDTRNRSQAWRVNAFEPSLPGVSHYSNFRTVQPSKILLPRSEEDRDAEVVYSDYADNKKRSLSVGWMFFLHSLNLRIGEEDRDAEVVYSDYADTD